MGPVRKLNAGRPARSSQLVLWQSCANQLPRESRAGPEGLGLKPEEPPPETEMHQRQFMRRRLGLGRNLPLMGMLLRGLSRLPLRRQFGKKTK